MAEDKGLEPQTIVDQPIPLIAGGFTQATGSNSNPVMSGSDASAPTTNVDQKWPVVQVAQETISQSLNTETKRILGEYTFESLGAIKVGQYSQGVSGEIAISPDGIVAKNINGDTTFALDGTTGDATFAGTVKAGNVEVVDATGLISLNNFVVDGVAIGTTFSTSSSSYVDITDITLTTPAFTRAVSVLIFAGSDVFASGTSGAGSTYSGKINIGIVVNNSVKAVMSMSASFSSVTGETDANETTIATHQFMTLPIGASVIKLQIETSGGVNLTANGLNNRLSYAVLGR